LMSFGNLVIPTAKHALEGRDMVRRAFDAAYRNGDLTFAAYSWDQLITNFLAVGDPLTEALAEGEKGLAFAEKAHFGLVVDLLTAQVQLIRTLRGLTPKFGCFNDDHFDELEFERHLASNPVLADPEFGYWALKVQARYLSLDYDAAVHASAKAQPLLWSAPSLLEPSAFRFYSALSHALAWDSAAPDKKQEHLEGLAAHHKQLETWAEHCPANFENRVALTGAEIARIEGRLLDAEGLYEKAMRSAHENGFIHNEAVACELAARFFAARGFDKIADTYLREARYCYFRWGADGKVRQLDQLYPQLREEAPTRGTTSTIVAPAELLDLATVIKVSQAVSGEMVLEKLIERIMRAGIEHAGAERGLLIRPLGDELQIEAEATITGNDVTVHLRDSSGTAAFPESVVRYVARTRKDVILDDATAGNPFSGDPYIAQRRARSIVCLPLVNQGRLNGIIFLENNLTAHVFTAERLAILKVLASQAAISLENTRLYRDLENREAKIRRLVDANILGITTWNVEGAILASNEAFLRMVQYDHDDVAAGRVRWRDMTPADWRERVERALAKVMQTGSVQPFESELFRKDGSRLPVLLAGALFEEGGNEGVAFALNLSEQKRAEEALRESENYLAEAQRLTHTGSCAIDGTSRKTLYWSEEMFRLFGFDPQQGLPTWDQWLQRIHAEDRDKVKLAAERTFLKKEDCDVEFKIVKSDGTVKRIHGIGHPVLNRNGELVQVVGTMVDITERRRAEEALRRSEAYLAESQRLTRTGSWASHGTTHEALYWSEEMFRLFGFDPQQGLPMRAQWLQRIHPEDRDRVKREASDRMFVQKVDSDVEYRIVLPDGTIKHIHGLAHPVFSSNGELVEVVGTVVDITERIRAENERERLRQELAHLAHLNRVSTMGELTASLAHEIKQPIGAAVTNAQACLRFLNRDQPDVPEAREAALEMARDATRAADIIDRVRSLYRKGSAHQEMVEVNEVIREMVVMLRKEANRYSVEMHTELCEDLPNVVADRVQLQQVLMNLMMNGIEAMRDAGGELSIKSQLAEDGQLLISVSDTGVGLPSGKDTEIFNAFFTTKSQGTGLGLAITRSIIESHGGRVWAAANPGRGATFQFTLPQKTAAHA
jgi:PAS domain S-box-containing protein